VRHIHLLFLAVLLGACGSNSTPYVPGDTVPLDTLDQLEADSALDTVDPDGWVTEGWKSITLEPREPEHLVAFLGTGGAASISVSSGGLGDGTQAPRATLGAFVTGQPGLLLVQTDAGFSQEVNGGAVAGPFFSLPPITLRRPALLDDGRYEASRTLVTLTVTWADQQTRSVSILVVANPGFDFGAGLLVDPGAYFADESAELRFRVNLSNAGTYAADKVYLQQMDATCTNSLESRLMRDDGDNVEGCDELASDQVFTLCRAAPGGDPGLRLYRVALNAQVGDQTLVAYSPCAVLRAVTRPARAEVELARSLVQEASDGFDEFLAGGDDVETATRKTLAHLRSRGSVAEAGAMVDGGLIWVRFGSGLLGAVPLDDGLEAPALPTEFTRTAGALTPVPPMSRRVLFEGPIQQGLQLTSAFEQRGCPGFQVRDLGTALSDPEAFPRQGLVVFQNGGGLAFGGLSADHRTAMGYAVEGSQAPVLDGWTHPGSQELLWSSTAVSPEVLSSTYQSCFYRLDGTCCVNCSKDPPELCPVAQRCLPRHSNTSGIPVGYLYDQTLVDLASGRLVVGPQSYGLLPSWFRAHGGSSAGARFAFLGGRDSLYHGAAALELTQAGFNTVLGLRGPVTVTQLSDLASRFLQAALDQQALPAELLPSCFATDSSGPLCYAGAGTLALHHEGLLNASFDQGLGLSGWEYSGDARPFTNWCGVAATDKTAALLSTGLGFTVQTGQLSQTFCLPVNATELLLDWNLISYEWPESCGKTFYQDQFKVVLRGEDGQTLPVTTLAGAEAYTINDLCDAESCGNVDACGGLYDPQAPLTDWPDTCAFDNGEAQVSGWRSLGPVAISSLAGTARPVTLTISVSDRGDATNDSTLLLDGLIIR
jgi:hypothetical protein